MLLTALAAVAAAARAELHRDADDNDDDRLPEQPVLDEGRRDDTCEGRGILRAELGAVHKVEQRKRRIDKKEVDPRAHARTRPGAGVRAAKREENARWPNEQQIDEESHIDGHD